MPEIPVKEVRLPELHLPEISRDEILKTVSEVRRPDFDLSDIQRPKIEMPDIAIPRLPSRLGSWRMPEIDIPAVDIANLIASAVATIDRDIAASTLDLLRDPVQTQTLVEITALLLEGLSKATHPFALVLDDYHRYYRGDPCIVHADGADD